MNLPIKIELPEGFLNEEVRCGYTVNEKMKAVWAVELDLLNELARVCSKYDIKYFADGGTLLGAIRHKGYIPWDDDIDVAMFRSDYEKLCRIAKDEFITPYFFQTEYTDPSSLRGHAQLRNSYTTGILRDDFMGFHTFNQGIFIDVFPIDAVPSDDTLMEKKIHNVKKYLKSAKRLACLGSRYDYCSNPIKNIIKKLEFYCFSGTLKKYVNYKKYYQKYEEECKTFNDNNTEKVAKFFGIPFKKNRVWYREDFLKTENWRFEMLEIPVPIGYKRILDIFFGSDWLTPKKVDGAHSGVIFDTYTPYTKYLEENKQ